VQYYLAELYLSRMGRRDLSVVAERVAAIAAHGDAARYVRSIFVPDDETCFYLFEAASADVVAHIGGQADVRFERILPAEVAP
jgi:hypothetical protein